MGRTRYIVIVAACLIAAVVLTALARHIVQHRARYQGEVIFVGHARGVLGTEYTRVYMWRDARNANPLPEVSIVIDGESRALASLSPEFVTERGGVLWSGGWYDCEGTIWRYRFENGRLTWFSVDSEHPTRSLDKANVDPGVFQISLDGGPLFSLPISHRDLVRLCGKPDETFTYFAN